MMYTSPTPTPHHARSYMLRPPGNKEIRKGIYKASVNNLLSLAILEEMERSMVRSPTSTTSPPKIEGSTYGRRCQFNTRLKLKAADDKRTNFVNGLQFLSLTNKLGLGDGCLQSAQGFVVQLLSHYQSHFLTSITTPDLPQQK